MTPSEEEPKQKTLKVSKEEFDVISNRLAVALAKRESLIKSWTASSSLPSSRTKTKTAEEQDAEDAALFRNQPQYLGVGAPIPAHFFTSDASQGSKDLRKKFGLGGLKASKARDVEEKAASAKRAKRDQDDSDEEQGRSGLGRAKKLKVKPRIKAVVKEDPVADIEAVKEDTSMEVEKVDERKIIHEGEDDPTMEETAKVEETSLPKPEAEEPAVEQKEEAPAENASSIHTSMEDTPMSDSPAPSDSTPKATPKHTMDPLEKKRMKKREKKKRMRAKQKMAQSVAE